MRTINRLDRRDLYCLLGLALLATALRLPGLGITPPGFQFDETNNALDALQLLEGRHRLFLPANAGREVLYIYWQAPYVALLGATPWGCRLPSAVVGIITVALLYVVARHVSKNHELAGISAACLTISYWHLHFSRYGIRSILVPMWMLLTLYAFWRALATRQRRWFLLCGLFLAAGIWTHPAGRIVPLIVAGYAALAIWAEPRRSRQVLLGLSLAGIISILLVAPLGLYFWRHPVAFYGHMSDVAVSRSGDVGDALRRLGQNALRVAAMFNLRGDAEWIHNLPGRPVFDPLLGLFFLLGLALIVRQAVRRDVPRPRRVLPLAMLLWMGVVLSLSVFSDMAPNYSRTIGALPAVMLTVGTGLTCAWRWLRDRSGRAWAAGALYLILVLSGGSTVYDYFWRFGRHPEAPYHYNQPQIEAADWLTAAMQDHVVYLSRLWARDATMRLLTDGTDLRSVETDAAVVIPARSGDDKAVLYAYPPELEQNALAMQATWDPLGGSLQRLDDSQGRLLLYLYRLPATVRPPLGQADRYVWSGRLPPEEITPTDDVYGEASAGGLRLLGYRVGDHVTTDQRLTVTLVWECLAPMDDRYNVYVHLLNAHGAICGQIDEEPGRGSYPTSSWRVGDVIIDRHSIDVSPSLPPESFSLAVGMYDWSTGEHLPTAEGAIGVRLEGPALNGVVPLAEGRGLDGANPLEENDLGVQAALVPDASVEQDQPFALSLVVDTDALQEARELRLILDREGSQVWSRPIETPSLHDDQARAERATVTYRQAIENVAPGHYTLLLTEADQRLALGEIELVESQRCYRLPARDLTTDAVFGDAIQLTGVNLPDVALEGDSAVLEPGTSLTVELVWQALTQPDETLTVFVHLLDADERVVAQHDGKPVDGGYATTAWVPDEVVVDRHRLTIPADLEAGEYKLEVGLYDAVSGVRPETVVAGQPIPERRVLLPVTLRAEGG